MTKQQADFMKELLGGLNNEITRQAQRITELEQQLAEAHEELALSIKERIELGGKLSRHQGWVEVEATLNFNLDSRKWEFVSWNVIEGRLLDYDNKRVRMHVMEVE